jgi:hypothetical protein
VDALENIQINLLALLGIKPQLTGHPAYSPITIMTLISHFCNNVNICKINVATGMIKSTGSSWLGHSACTGKTKATIF